MMTVNTYKRGDVQEKERYYFYIKLAVALDETGWRNKVFSMSTTRLLIPVGDGSSKGTDK